MCDLSNRNERLKLIKKAKEFQPDLVINNAGFGLYGNSLNLDVDELIDMIETNSISVMEISIALAKDMIPGSVIVNISSIAGSMPMSGMSVYGATKAFVTSFSKALRIELEDKKIDVLTFIPGGIQTNFAKRAAKHNPRPKLIKLQKLFSMSPYFAVQKLLTQIEKRKPICYPRKKDRLSSFFGSFSFVQRKMKRLLSD